MEPIYIHAFQGICSAGDSIVESWSRLIRGKSDFKFPEKEGQTTCARLNKTSEDRLNQLKKEKNLKRADRAVLLGLLCARDTCRDLGSVDFRSWGVIFASSRGATIKLETEHQSFLSGKKICRFTSPHTTMGSFSTTISQDLHLQGLSVSLSSACSSSLHAIGIGSKIVSGGTEEGMLVGGAEASLTPFTLKQLQAVGILRPGSDNHGDSKYEPFNHSNRIIPGEASACLALSHHPKDVQNNVAIIGYGASTDSTSLIGLDPSGNALANACRKALLDAEVSPYEIDGIVAHGSGMKVGDDAELSAYRQVFAKAMPPITCHKWLVGHTLGAAGSLSVALAVCDLKEGVFTTPPYLVTPKCETHPRILLVCALGFGGNAAAIVLKRI